MRISKHQFLVVGSPFLSFSSHSSTGERQWLSCRRHFDAQVRKVSQRGLEWENYDKKEENSIQQCPPHYSLLFLFIWIMTWSDEYSWSVLIITCCHSFPSRVSPRISNLWNILRGFPPLERSFYISLFSFISVTSRLDAFIRGNSRACVIVWKLSFWHK